MTLYKQMALLISIVLLLILTSIMILSFQNANEAVQENLYEDAKNTASSLSLSLGTAEGDIGIMQTMINANFDSGHYVRIALIDMDENTMYERIAEQSKPDVADWFINTVTIHVPIASAQVSAGWNPLGILYVQSDPASAYVQLYKTFRDLLISFSIIALISLLVLNSLLHIVLKPLKSVQSQAEAILENRFIIQDFIPFTTEFKDVVKGMNAMVTKVKDIFDKANEAMARNQELMYHDPVSKLFNRRYLMLKLPSLISLANEKSGGMLFFIAFEGADIVNQKLGRQKADNFFKLLGEAFISLSKPFDEYIVARVNGTEFALMLPNCDNTQGSEVAKELNIAMQNLKQEHNLAKKDCNISMGLYRYNNNQDTPTLMTKTDHALSQAKAQENDNIYLYDQRDDSNTMQKEQWRSIITNAMEKNYFNLIFWPVYDSKHKRIIQKVLTFCITDDSAKEYSYGSFISHAIGLGYLTEMYLFALEKLFLNPPSQQDKEFSIRLSSDFLRSEETYERLKILFQTYSKEINFTISFEISDSIVLQNLELVRHFGNLFHSFGYKIGINQFSGASKDFSYLQEIRPKFIKADIAFLLDQNSESISSLQLMTDSLGIELIATGVSQPQELQKLHKIKVKTVQGVLAENLAYENDK
ncbi:MAG: LapD/MoxY N-terminal periplasmic domain-containing protein [Campylobacterota bacterium]|nr:LapD/MoxY N-terminal periplasmic domain-containing protein [Campylobacterota bacterium]